MSEAFTWDEERIGTALRVPSKVEEICDELGVGVDEFVHALDDLGMAAEEADEDPDLRRRWGRAER